MRSNLYTHIQKTHMTASDTSLMIQEMNKNTQTHGVGFVKRHFYMCVIPHNKNTAVRDHMAAC